MADLLELAHSSKLKDFGKSIQTVHLVETSRELRRQQQETIQKAVGHLVKLEFVNGDDEDNEEKTAKKRSLPTPVAQQKPRVDDGVVLSFRRRFHQSERLQSELCFCDRFGSGIPFIKVFTVGDTSDIPFEPGERVFARRSGSI